MILSRANIEYFQLLHSRVIKSMGTYQTNFPYFLDGDSFFNYYEALRSVWCDGNSIKNSCSKFKVSRSCFYEYEKNFVAYGFPGLLSLPGIPKQYPELEKLVLLTKKSRPNLSYTAIHRIAQAVPITKNDSRTELVSRILQSHGYGISNMKDDLEFWGRIQRTLQQWTKLLANPLGCRNINNRKDTFLIDADHYHKRLELLRRLFFEKSPNQGEVCNSYKITNTTFYRLVEEYKLYGQWAIIPACAPGKEGIGNELQLTIILEKLKHPTWSPEYMCKELELDISRYAVHRVISRWGVLKKDRIPVSLNEFLGNALLSSKTQIQEPVKPSYHILSEKTILATKRINRHFERICRKIKTGPLHICDPGPFLLSPFVNDLGVVHAFETYGPTKLRGKEVTNLALLNVFRILAGYRRINHLSNNRDRSVALASGVGMYGSTSKYYEDTIEFTFEQLHQLRSDLVARAMELGLIEGLKIGYDFHFKEFYGKHADEKQIGKGPNKAGNLVPGFRPHVAWDLAANVIISIAYFQGATRAPRILKQFCEQNIFPILDPLAIQEIYMDSEYTKEGDFHYLKESSCKNSDIYICLKKNKQIIKLTKPALEENDGWENYDDSDESKSIQVQLPKTGLFLTIVILRDRETKQKIRCFGSTNMTLSKTDILRKYRYRWIIENGLKDLVASYYIDEIYGEDPQKIEFEFYCVMIARLAYEYFLRELNGKYLNNVDGNKCTLQNMRNLVFEKRNCTVEQNESGNLVLTILDSNNTGDLEKNVSEMLINLANKGKNKVLWWNNRGIYLCSSNQYDFLKSVRPVYGKNVRKPG